MPSRRTTLRIAGALAVSAWLAAGRAGAGPQQVAVERRPRAGDEDHGAVKSLTTIRATPGLVLGVAFSPDGSRVLVGCHDGNVSVWEADSGRLVRTLVEGPKYRPPPTGEAALQPAPAERPRRLLFPAESVAFSPDGRRAAVGSTGDQKKIESAFSFTLIWAGGLIRVWDVETGRLVSTIKGDRSPARGLAFSPDGELLSSIDLAYDFKIREIDGGREVVTVIGEDLGAQVGYSSGPTTSFDREARRAVSTLDDEWKDQSVPYKSTLKLWDAEAGSFRALDPEERFGSSGGHTAALSPDGRTVAVGFGSRGLKLIDFSTAKVLAAVEPSSESRFGLLQFSPDGQRLVSGSNDGILEAWEVAGQKLRLIRTLHGPKRIVRAVAFLDDGRVRVASGGFIPSQEKHPATGNLMTEPMEIWEAELFTPPHP